MLRYTSNREPFPPRHALAWSDRRTRQAGKVSERRGRGGRRQLCRPGSIQLSRLRRREVGSVNRKTHRW